MAMVDKNIVLDKINSLKVSLKRLEHLQTLSQTDFLGNFANFDAAKYNFITAIEAMIDIANHIISRENFEIPTSSADSFKTLVKNGILPQEHLNTFIAMVKFRNKAVHLYYEIKDEEVYRILQENLNDFDLFIKTILNFLKL